MQALKISSTLCQHARSESFCRLPRLVQVNVDAKSNFLRWHTSVGPLPVNKYGNQHIGNVTSIRKKALNIREDSVFVFFRQIPIFLN